MLLTLKKNKTEQLGFKAQGFTLIELLIATSILGIVGLTILTTFASGFQVYDRVQTFGGAQADIYLALEEMEKNLRNIFPMSSIAFEGGAQSIAFPMIVERLETIDDEEQVITSIGKVSYAFDAENKELIRAQYDYSQSMGSGGVEPQRSALGAVENLKYSYYFFNEKEERFGWSDVWESNDSNGLLGVKIELVYLKENREIELSRTIFIPVKLGIDKNIAEAQEGEEEIHQDEEAQEGEGEQL